MKKQFKKISVLLLLVLFSLTACKEEKVEVESSDNVEYIQQLTTVEFKEDLSVKEINKAFTDIYGEEAVTIKDKLSADSLIKAVVENSDLKELALSYKKEDYEKILKDYEIKDIETKNKNYIACALEQNLVSKDIVEDLYKKESKKELEKISSKYFVEIIEGSLNNTGLGKNYIGTTLDDDIGAKLNNKWESFILFENKELQDLGNEAVKSGIVTGYNLKNTENNSNFDPEKTIIYGHSSIKHGQQLLGLLKSKNIEAKIQLEPKISVFKYLLEWGPIPEPTPIYEVKKDGEDYFVYAVEYDLIIEFANDEDMKNFDGIIEKYAKKNEGNEEGKGLLLDSWWQPLYTTTNNSMDKEKYIEIKDCIIKNGIYEIHPFATVENAPKVIEELTKDNDFEAEAKTRYCNKAFFNYLIGEDYQ